MTWVLVLVLHANGGEALFVRLPMPGAPACIEARDAVARSPDVSEVFCVTKN